MKATEIEKFNPLMLVTRFSRRRPILGALLLASSSCEPCGLSELSWEYGHGTSPVQSGASFTGATAVTIPPACTSLIAHGEGLGDVGLEVLSIALLSTPISELHLQGNGIHDRGAAALGAVVGSRGSRLERLILTGNSIGDRGCIGLARGIADRNERADVPFRELFLNHNRVGSIGASALARAGLAHPGSRLERLMLSGNYIGDDGANAFASALQLRAHALENSSDSNLLHLSRFYMHGNPISGIAESSLTAAIEGYNMAADAANERPVVEADAVGALGCAAAPSVRESVSDSCCRASCASVAMHARRVGRSEEHARPANGPRSVVSRRRR